MAFGLILDDSRRGRYPLPPHSPVGVRLVPHRRGYLSLPPKMVLGCHDMWCVGRDLPLLLMRDGRIMKLSWAAEVRIAATMVLMEVDLCPGHRSGCHFCVLLVHGGRLFTGELGNRFLAFWWRSLEFLFIWSLNKLATFTNDRLIDRRDMARLFLIWAQSHLRLLEHQILGRLHCREVGNSFLRCLDQVPLLLIWQINCLTLSARCGCRWCVFFLLICLEHGSVALVYFPLHFLELLIWSSEHPIIFFVPHRNYLHHFPGIQQDPDSQTELIILEKALILDTHITEELQVLVQILLSRLLESHSTLGIFHLDTIRLEQAALVLEQLDVLRSCAESQGPAYSLHHLDLWLDHFSLLVSPLRDLWYISRSRTVRVFHAVFSWDE